MFMTLMSNKLYDTIKYLFYEPIRIIRYTTIIAYVFVNTNGIAVVYTDYFAVW